MTETQKGDARSPELKLPKLVVRWLAGPRPNKDRHARSDTMGDDRMHRLTTCLKRLCPLTNIYPRTWSFKRFHMLKKNPSDTQCNNPSYVVAVPQEVRDLLALARRHCSGELCPSFGIISATGCGRHVDGTKSVCLPPNVPKNMVM